MNDGMRGEKRDKSAAEQSKFLSNLNEKMRFYSIESEDNLPQKTNRQEMNEATAVHDLSFKLEGKTMKSIQSFKISSVVKY